MLSANKPAYQDSVIHRPVVWFLFLNLHTATLFICIIKPSDLQIDNKLPACIIFINPEGHY